MFNEMEVAERLVRSACEISYPKNKLEKQVLDDSTDSTPELVKPIVAEFLQKGFNIKYNPSYKP